jgi:hypothetical protein
VGKTLYDELVVLDANLARYYRYLKERHPHRKLNKKEAHEIFAGGLMDGDEITANEAKALALLIKNDQFDRAALKYLKKEAMDIETAYALAKGGGAKPLHGDQLKKFDAALGMHIVGGIHFTNPQTGSSYNPCAYQVVKELVHQDEIRVYEFPHGKLDGGYNQFINVLVIYNDTDRKEKIDTIVHEMTHAIQDWRDINLPVEHAEADAYIAGSVAFDKVGGTRAKGGTGPAEVAFNEALPLIKAGKANSLKNHDWIKAHHKVVDAIKNDPNYSGGSYRFKEKKGKGPSERSRMLEVWKAIKDKECKTP